MEESVFARLLTRWQGVTRPRRGLDALLDAIELLQGAALPASELERAILPARVAGYTSADLDTLMAAGEVVWVGRERLGERDGRIALYLTDSLPLLLPPRDEPPQLSQRAARVVEELRSHGASFFTEIHAQSGGGFPGETLESLWELVWAGLVTNDSFHPVRGMLRPANPRRAHSGPGGFRPGSPEFLRRFRSRTAQSAHGRWSIARAAPRLGALAHGMVG